MAASNAAPRPCSTARPGTTPTCSSAPGRPTRAGAPDGMRRHFEYDWQDGRRAQPGLRATSCAAERERLGAEHPLFLTPVLPAAAARRRTPAQPDAALAASRRPRAPRCAGGRRDLRRRPRHRRRGIDTARERPRLHGADDRARRPVPGGRWRARRRGRAPLRLEGRAARELYGAPGLAAARDVARAAGRRRRDRHRRAAGGVPDAARWAPAGSRR